MKVDFIDKREDGNVGEYYDCVVVDGVALEVGDYVVWNDPDAGLHAGECELIHDEEWVARVSEIVRFDKYDDPSEALHIGLDCPLGWVRWEDIAIPGEKDNGIIGARDAEAAVEGLKNRDEFERYIIHSYHAGRDGTPEGLWEVYEEKDYGYSGPHCDVCMGDGHEVKGE